MLQLRPLDGHAFDVGQFRRLAEIDQSQGWQSRCAYIYCFRSLTKDSIPKQIGRVYLSISQRHRRRLHFSNYFQRRTSAWSIEWSNLKTATVQCQSFSQQHLQQQWHHHRRRLCDLSRLCRVHRYQNKRNHRKVYGSKQQKHENQKKMKESRKQYIHGTPLVCSKRRSWPNYLLLTMIPFWKGTTPPTINCDNVYLKLETSSHLQDGWLVEKELFFHSIVHAILGIPSMCFKWDEKSRRLQPRWTGMRISGVSNTAVERLLFL